MLIRVQFCALVPTRSRAAVSLGGESRPTVSASHMGGMRCADDRGAGLEQVIGVAGVHLLIMGLALGHCGITEIMASCKLGVLFSLVYVSEKKKTKSKIKCFL